MSKAYLWTGMKLPKHVETNVHMTYAAWRNNGERTHPGTSMFSISGFSVDNPSDYNRIVSNTGAIDLDLAALYVQVRIEEKNIEELALPGSAYDKCSHKHNLMVPVKPLVPHIQYYRPIH